MFVCVSITNDAVKVIESGVVRTMWWHELPSGRVQCDLCPRGCQLRNGQRGYCTVRENRGGEIVMTAYGRPYGLHVDPIEKKPLYHFLPGTSVLSFGTAGCNLGCRFCQNWHMSRATKVDRRARLILPEAIAGVARRESCASVAFTYNEPIVFAEYAIETAKECRRSGIKTVAVTAGYISSGARRAFFDPMDAVNVDLKAFSDGFYRRLCFARLQPVLETLEWIRRETTTWLEVTTLVIPGENDDEDELRRLSAWCASRLGQDTPLHLSAYHPAYRHVGRGSTQACVLDRVRRIAMGEGLLYVYAGNVMNEEAQSTWCSACGKLLIRRSGFVATRDWLDERGFCRSCGEKLAGMVAE